MINFGNNKKKQEEEEKARAELEAQKEQMSKAMREMSDQVEAKAKEVAELEKKLEAARKDAEKVDVANKAVADAQAKMRQMQADLNKAQQEANKAKAAATAAATSTASAASQAVAEGSRVVLGGAPKPAVLAVGVTAWVQKAGGKNLRLRDKPGLNSNAFDGLVPGTQMTLLEGPTQLDGYPWWRIRAADGREGWVAGSELVLQPE
ncbi:SH3 domain-containing protein [Candidatus Chloroploca sp. M-50]|uniref:SH3 domain-containing protein n=1 Tax=Candidatus Chloroploca mongolica TaxID=2528176 RepID=A0ABS4DA92_9CHLR|nr:SH3 domain-containing protein [Candidatus Chloroploca mongolica]MBP1466366.1 SH3 domain-containing protein [Candidatus Chloroploca mongolica]